MPRGTCNVQKHFGSKEVYLQITKERSDIVNTYLHNGINGSCSSNRKQKGFGFVTFVSTMGSRNVKPLNIFLFS